MILLRYEDKNSSLNLILINILKLVILSLKNYQEYEGEIQIFKNQYQRIFKNILDKIQETKNE